MADPGDGELVRQARGGDTEAFGRLVERHMRGVYALAYSFTQNHADADDLAQEAFLRAYRALGSFRERSSFRTWLYRIAANACMNHLSRRVAPTRSLDGVAAPAGAIGPAEAALLSELEQRVAQAAAQLPAGLRAALHLVVHQELSHQEAAEVMGCTKAAVAWRVFRARELMMERLGPFLPDRAE